MLQAMFNGVSAVEANQQDMDVIGNNIANVNTTAYKAGRVTFQDQLSQTLQGASAGNGVVGGTNPVQVGLGVRIGAIDTVMAQGGLQSSSSPTDMAIQGNGYFMLGSGSGISYTRDGSFSIDNSGNLVNAGGSYVLGWLADQNGNIDASKEISPASHLTVPVGGLEATAATTKAAFGGNLSSDAAPGDPAYTRSIKVYDSLGKAQTVSLSFTRDTPPSAATDTATTGGSLAAGSYSVGYSYVNASGETEMSPVQTVSVDGTTTNAITVDAGTLPAGATNIKVYVGTSQSSMALAGTSANNSGSFTVNALPAVGAATPRASSWSWSATIP
ncbi:MAG: flagellar hook-basal body complex protein, partial [Armatimonadetes bacterium]|nr:flagellar hook-basal body complex protein [Armatimonadota bacterium]